MKLRILTCVIAIAALTAVFVFPALAQKAPAFSIERLAVATGIEDREPVGVAETIPADTEQVYCFIEARNISRDTTVKVVWVYQGEEVHQAELPLAAGPRWRTWAVKTLGGLSGFWVVEISDEEGNFMDVVEFWVK